MGVSIPLSVLCVAVLLKGAQAGCCFPPQQEGMADMVMSNIVNGSINFQLGKIHFYFDMTNKKQRNEMEIFSEAGVTRIVYLDDYSVTPNIRYQIQDGTCHTVDPTTPQYPCIPEEIEPIETMRIGNPKGGIMASLYDVKPGKNHRARIWVDDDCIGLSQQTEFEINGVKNVLSMTYYNLKLQIDDPSIFDIPEICKQAKIEL